MRDLALQNALRKRAAGVPTYSVPEAAALLSVSQEHLYRLIRADAFPAVRMRTGGDQGRYVIPAKAVEQILDAASAGSGRVDVVELAETWRTATTAPSVRGGAA
ncbi:MAG: helix-turn-helix domain-containing protein [Actinopolymorphaceae bacterium]